jgi:hypothetical protein
MDPIDAHSAVRHHHHSATSSSSSSAPGAFPVLAFNWVHALAGTYPLSFFCSFSFSLFSVSFGFLSRRFSLQACFV